MTSTLPYDNNFSERAKKAFDFAADTTKQLITISTAVITLTVTFSKNLYTGSIPVSLWLSWAFYFISITAGIFTLLTLTGALGSSKTSNNKLTIYTAIIRVPSLIQLTTFILGLLSFTVFAFKS